MRLLKLQSEDGFTTFALRLLPAAGWEEERSLDPSTASKAHALEGVEGRGVAVRAVGARADVVAKHAEVGDATDADEVHAVRHVVVLA
eukprot:CAMPEP_0177429916 /NCGR_PEP_ID=MMETSP0368-20130122/75362_1 /TAXON_ID=447022 ORGANISM="Scrippsiella hangoei-like, Strain SHHI-4" /NCGR_SAMPLE_ID=MMETSP0368 /ASSEMBLY_ACC=CAM_ASM_000363 /LENGTH=87 /DNA_ID=CAMNT_0018900443 /DNA_START=471 /DNA_END=732 /DNA_ORIENTATION=+